jgi:hypothetical protein
MFDLWLGRVLTMTVLTSTNAGRTTGRALQDRTGAAAGSDIGAEALFDEDYVDGTRLGARSVPREAAPGHPRPAHPHTGARLVRVGPYSQGRGPARLAAAPRPARAVSCAPRRAGGSLVWLAAMAGVACLVVLAFVWAGSGSSAAGVPTATTVVQVHQGETLWDVAGQEAPGSRADEVVAQIVRLNSLSDESVYPGEMLRVPTSLHG